MQVRTTRSSAGGDIGCTAEIGCGSEARIAATMLAWLLPVKARCPRPFRTDTAPSGEDVGARIGFFTFQLLGRHVLKCA